MLYLLRHGDAEDGDGEDAARRLTAKGERQAEAAGRALAALGVRLGACLTSPKVRAAETARLACAPLGIEPEIAEELRGGRFDGPASPPGAATSSWSATSRTSPARSARLTGANVKLKKGGLAIVDGSTLLALLRPKELAAIAAAKDRTTAMRLCRFSDGGATPGWAWSRRSGWSTSAPLGPAGRTGARRWRRPAASRASRRRRPGAGEGRPLAEVRLLSPAPPAQVPGDRAQLRRPHRRERHGGARGADVLQQAGRPASSARAPRSTCRRSPTSSTTRASWRS